MLHLRLIIPPDRTDVVLAELVAMPGVVHIVRIAGSTTSRPTGDVVLCDVVREAANDVVERLQDHRVHHEGAIAIEAVQVVVSDAAEAAESQCPGEAGDAMVWEELEARVRDDGTLTTSFLIFMAVAAMIAAIGVLLDSAVLVIGAMVVGPDYGPLAALCVAIVRRRRAQAARAARTIATGLLTAAAAAFVATLLFRATSMAPQSYDIGHRVLTAFISRPDALSAVVAILAGVVGMLALTEARTGALIGVLVSVTTIPALGNIGVAMAYGAWHELVGAALQLGVNVSGLVLAGIATLFVQSRSTTSNRARRHAALRGAGAGSRTLQR